MSDMQALIEFMAIFGCAAAFVGLYFGMMRVCLWLAGIRDTIKQVKFDAKRLGDTRGQVRRLEDDVFTLKSALRQARLDGDIKGNAFRGL